MPHGGLEGVMGAVEGESSMCEGLGRCRKGIQRLQDVRSHSATAE